MSSSSSFISENSNWDVTKSPSNSARHNRRTSRTPNLCGYKVVLFFYFPSSTLFGFRCHAGIQCECKCITLWWNHPLHPGLSCKKNSVTGSFSHCWHGLLFMWARERWLALCQQVLDLFMFVYLPWFQSVHYAKQSTSRIYVIFPFMSHNLHSYTLPVVILSESQIFLQCFSELSIYNRIISVRERLTYKTLCRHQMNLKFCFFWIN